MCRFLSRHKFFNQLGKYLGVQLLVQITFNFVKNCQIFFQICLPFSIPTSKKWEFPLLHIFASNWYYQFGDFCHSMRYGWQRMRWLHSITDSMDMNLTKVWEIVKDRETWHITVYKVVKSQAWLSNWTTTTIKEVDGNILSF